MDFFVLFAILFMLYKLVPNHKVLLRPALLSASLAAMLLGTAADSYRWIILKFFNYSKIYGSLAALPLALLWILIAWYIVLLGVVVCASAHRDSIVASKVLR